MSNLPLGRLHSGNDAASAGFGIHPRTRFVFEFMQAHCGEHLTLARVAESVNLSGSRLRHVLRAETGVTFSALLREFRLLKAEALLADWLLNISEIAYRCGYESVPSISREFKGRFGMCPSRYRCARLSRPRDTAFAVAA